MIKAEALCKTYDGKYVLDNVSFTVQDGSVVGILGPSGVGKTTLLNIIMGLVSPDSGIISFDNKNKVEAAVFQEDRLFENLSAFENIRLVVPNVSSEEILESLKFLIPDTDYINTPVSKFSGGMKRRVAIIRACLKASTVVVMDEPFTGLDEELINKCSDYIIQRCKGKTLFIATHIRGQITFDKEIVIN